jgi:hypothetical protein
MLGLWVVLGTLSLGLIAGGVMHARNGQVRAARPAHALPGPVAARWTLQPR